MKSGWCAPGALGRPDHGGCKWVACDCSCGHPGRETPAVERDSQKSVSARTGMIGATNKAAPGGASTPFSQGLADYQGVDS